MHAPDRRHKDRTKDLRRQVRSRDLVVRVVFRVFRSPSCHWSQRPTLAPFLNFSAVCCDGRVLGVGFGVWPDLDPSNDVVLTWTTGILFYGYNNTTTAILSRMTGILAPTLIALSLGNLLKEKGSHVLQKTPPAVPPASTTTNLIQVLYAKWFGLSSLVRFFVSGNLGNVCFFFIERFIYLQLSNLDTAPQFVEDYCETVSFFVGYLLQILTQHLLHAFLVYGLESIDTREKYFKTLLGQFYVYAVALFGSTTLNLFLIQSRLDKTVAFFSTMVVFACINYFLIGWLVKRALKSANHDQPTLPPSSRSVSASKLLSNKKSDTSITKGKSTSGVKESAFNSNAARKIRRGGAFAFVGSSGGGRKAAGWVMSPTTETSIHHMVLDSGVPVNVDSVNEQ